MMESELLIIPGSHPKGAFKAVGIVVIIGILCGFTSTAFILHLGSEKILLLSDPVEVLRAS